ncbi:MAG TPA: vanadium-dependent haloperoxidase, partial [Longimicrobiales bacterium]|nr:vanadium-dependent haloperoxidase [Longimicrobiales bacterium]
FGPFVLTGATVDADPVAAANEAAYAVAMSQYPDHEQVWAAERSRWRDSVLPAAPADPARMIGERAAAAVLEAREGDDWDGDPAYRWHPMAPGVYAEFREHSRTPEGFVFGAGWAAARPFLLERPSQLRVGPPPDVASEAYTRAFHEVKEVGSRDSATRTADQTHLAMWWKEFVEKSHNRLARELVAAEGLGLWEAARLFAVLNMSVFDGYVAVFDSKFHHNHWRPYTAIRWASNDGNPDTEEDPDWTNLHDHTYAFPSYPSAHGTVCAAAMTVLESVFGEDRPFEMTIREVDSAGPMSPKVAMDPATRSFASFQEAAEECSLSRVYLGIHFRYDSEAGTELGRQVGALAVRDFLRPRGSPRSP